MFKSVVLLLLVFLAGFGVIVRSEDDIIIETADEKDQSKTAEATGPDVAATGTETAGEQAVPLSLSSPDADTTVFFTFPQNTKDIPTNKPIRLLIGFRNKGQSDFVVDYLDASLRYPMDYSYIITNFTSIRYSRHVPAQQEATFDYGFFLHDAFSARPFTLSVNLHYHDSAEKMYSSAVYNETIQVVEIDEGLDSQTFFLYLMFASILVLLGLVARHYLPNVVKKRPGAKNRAAKAAPVVESGTSKSSDVDYDWLPESVLRDLNKSPKKSPAQSRSPQLSPKAKKRV